MARRRRSKKWISWLIILVLLIAAIIVAYQVWDNYFNDKKESETSKETDKEETKKEEPKNEPEENHGVDGGEQTKKEETVQYEGENPNTNSELTGAITYAAVSGNNVLIRINIDQYLSSGSCEIRLVKEGDLNVYSDVANIVNSASTSTCEGFNIPLSKVGSGNYVIYVNLKSGDKSGTINGEVNI